MPGPQQQQMPLPVGSFPELTGEQAQQFFFDQFKDTALFWMLQMTLNSIPEEDAQLCIDEMFDTWRNKLLQHHSNFLEEFARMKLSPHAPQIPANIIPPQMDKYAEILKTFETSLRPMFEKQPNPESVEEETAPVVEENSDTIVMDFSKAMKQE